jgi:hypothetical protein
MKSHEIPWTEEEPQTNAKNAYVRYPLELQDEEEYICTPLKFNFGTLLLRILFLRRSHPWTGDNYRGAISCGARRLRQAPY